jgi:hypothetical protein
LGGEKSYFSLIFSEKIGSKPFWGCRTFDLIFVAFAQKRNKREYMTTKVYIYAGFLWKKSAVLGESTNNFPPPHPTRLSFAGRFLKAL